MARKVVIPDITTKNADSANPLESNLFDSDVNELKNSLVKSDENFVEVYAKTEPAAIVEQVTPAVIVTKLESIAVEDDKPEKTVIKNFNTEVTTIVDTRVLPANPDQIVNLNGLATIASVYNEGTGTVTFNTSKVQGSSASPKYNFLTVSNTNPRDLNNVVVKHSSLVVPAVLIPNKPSSPLPVYADQAAMLADQVNQVSGSYYAYTGSTSMWLYNGVANGLITDYTEVVEVTGWEEWGTKPEWLIVQGDAYLVGEDNINTLSFVFYELIKISGVSYHDTVICTVTSHTAMNRDADRIVNNSIILANFNENDNPVQPDSVTNESVYADFFPFNVTRPEQAFYVDLTGGNYSFDIGTNPIESPNTVSARTTLEIAVSEQGQLAMNPDEITIISRSNYRTSGSTQNRGIYVSLGDVSGINFLYNETNLRLDVLYRDITGVSRGLNSDAFLPIQAVDNGYWVFAVKIYWDGTNTNVEFYIKSSDNSVAFQKLGSTRQRPDRPNIISDQIVFDRSSYTVTTGRPISIDYMQVIPKGLTEAEILTIANTID